MTQPLLRMEAISKSFPGVQALSHVDFSLERSEIHALVGKNGAGKSTLMKVLGGVHAPDQGAIQIEGREVRFSGPHAAHEAGVAIVHQELSLVPALTVAENIFLGRLTGGGALVPWRSLAARAAAVLARLDSHIPPRATVGELSVAEQQIVEIAKALSRDPKILVLDEPTSALSDADGARLLDILRGLSGRGVGIIYISHRLVEVERVAHRVTVLRDGRTVGSAAMATLDRPAIVRMMLGADLAGPDAVQRAPAPAQDVVLSVRGLSRSGVLDDISFEVRRGEILGIAGLIGAGRTELVRAIFGRDPVDAGEIRLAGRPVRHPSPRRMKRLGVGFLPEDRKRQALVLDLSVRENVALTIFDRLTRGGVVDRTRERAIVARLIADLEIATAGPEQAVRNLSGGNQQKVVIAKWLATEPQLLILDEPTRGVDVHAKAQIFRILDSLSERGVAIIFISSELEEVLAVSHRILTMARGRIVAEQAGGADMADILLSAVSG